MTARRPVDSRPSLKLLAGPIVRRVSRECAWVWIATSQDLPQPRLVLYGHDRGSGRWIRRTESLNAWSGVHHLRISASFHVYLLAASQRPIPGVATTHERAAARLRHSNHLPHDMPIGYDVRWGEAADEGGGATDNESGLESLGALEGVVVTPFDRPTFIIQNPNSPSFRALYGSCRKFHGHGADAIVVGERTLRRYAGNLGLRPHVLLLGGDQIYADDVPDTLIRPIQELARTLMSGSEPLPGIARPDRLGIRERQVVTEQNAHFSGSASGNHLMTFGEFSAVYLMAWNPEVWPRHLPPLRQVARGIRPRPELQELQAIAAERRRVAEFKNATSAARRLMSNVATYMMFDDHEITDDWNLNADWERNVSQRQLGPRIMANGLAAFWLFQAWGNDPDRMSRQEFRQSLASYASAPMQGGARLEREFLQFHDWAFRTPTRPSAVFANTRTRRTRTTSPQRRFISIPVHPPARSADLILPYRVEAAPRLMNTDERRHLRSLLDAARRDDRRVLLVTPTPVFGLERLEFFQDVVPMWLDVLKSNLATTNSPLLRDARSLRLRNAVQAYVREFDGESFHANPNSYLDVLSDVVAAGGRELIVLSGDVHYGFSSRAQIQFHGQRLNIVQHTSSATKNKAVEVNRVVLQAAQMGFMNGSGGTCWWRTGDRTTAIPRESVDAVRGEEGRRGAPHVSETFEYIPRRSPNVLPNGFDQIAELRNNMGWLRLDGGRGHHHLLAVDRENQLPCVSIPYSWHI